MESLSFRTSIPSWFCVFLFLIGKYDTWALPGGSVMVLHRGYSACLRLGSQGNGSEIKISVWRAYCVVLWGLTPLEGKDTKRRKRKQDCPEGGAGPQWVPRKASDYPMGTVQLGWSWVRGRGLCICGFSLTSHWMPLVLDEATWGGAWPWARQLFSAKTFPEEGWELGAFCPPWSQQLD